MPSSTKSGPTETIGCFHCILPVVVATADRPGLGVLMGRVAVQTLRTQSRYRIGYLTLRQLMSTEERRRGGAIADGTIVNFAFDEGFAVMQRSSEKELLAAAAGAVGELELLIGRNETMPDHRGLDCYLMTRITDGVTVASATFNGAVLTPPQMRALLIGPEQLLAAHLQGGLEWDGIRRIAHSGDPYAPVPPAVPTVGSIWCCPSGSTRLSPRTPRCGSPPPPWCPEPTGRWSWSAAWSANPGPKSRSAPPS